MQNKSVFRQLLVCAEWLHHELRQHLCCCCHTRQRPNPVSQMYVLTCVHISSMEQILKQTVFCSKPGSICQEKCLAHFRLLPQTNWIPDKALLQTLGSRLMVQITKWLQPAQKLSGPTLGTNRVTRAGFLRSFWRFSGMKTPQPLCAACASPLLSACWCPSTEIPHAFKYEFPYFPLMGVFSICEHRSFQHELTKLGKNKMLCTHKPSVTYWNT